ncbi:MAG: MFS transporter [Phenylobacterium sp.]|uniref:MFS transporter n=1 Tax=Phenylobacterium sp. TaxID=1871053 RepID=UPI002736C771|nr:MFS transporter [Phenylobacterium sp.]MDP3174247.1 MFS transporter [Phenylobacterium sp.]
MAETGATSDLSPVGAVGLTPMQRLRNILGGSAGNFVEWFDWFAYVSFAIYFSSAIFPGDDQTTRLLKTYLPFALGFVARPLGAYLMGVYADKAGRKAALTLSVSLMCAGSLMIALIPTSGQIGLLAPLLLTVARIAQGLSVGGEYGASATYVSEMSSRKHRGFWSGFLYVTLIAGQLAAVLLLVILQQLLTEAQLQAWGWRIPFVIGAMFAVVVFWIRMRMHETPAFATAGEHESRGKSMMLFTHYPRETAMIFVLTAGGGAAFYFFTTYMKDFLVNSAAGPTGDGFGKEAAALITTALLVCFMAMQPLVGWLSDQVGRRPILIASFGLGALMTYPISMAIMAATTASQAFLLCLPPLVALTGYTAISAIIKAELFPAHLRASGVAVPYALAQALFGGNVGTTALSLKKAGHEPVMFWIIAGLLAAGLVVAMLMRDTRRHSLILED